MWNYADQVATTCGDFYTCNLRTRPQRLLWTLSKIFGHPWLTECYKSENIEKERVVEGCVTCCKPSGDSSPLFSQYNQNILWYGHVERMDPTRLPKIMVHWKPEGRKKRGRPRRTWKDGIYTAMNERDLKMGEWNNRRQWNMAVGRRRQTF